MSDSELWAGWGVETAATPEGARRDWPHGAPMCIACESEPVAPDEYFCCEECEHRWRVEG